MDQLCEDLIVNIFSNLEVKTILKLRCICKLWRQIIDGSSYGPQLAKKQLKNVVEEPLLLVVSNYKPSQSHDDHNNPNPNPNKSMNQRLLEINLKSLFPWASQLNDNKNEMFFESCADGILCFSRVTSLGTTPYLINPLRQDVLELPPLNVELINGVIQKHFSYGLGFDKSTRKYKVVCAVVDWYSVMCEPFTTTFYTLKDSKWIELEKSQPQQHCVPIKGGPKYINGVIYWNCYNSNAPNNKFVIMGFDVEKEQFRLIPMPSKLGHGDEECFYFDQLIDLNIGVLSYVDLSSTNHIEIWNLKNCVGDHDEKENWVRMYKFEMKAPHNWSYRFHPYRVIGTWENGEILLKGVFDSFITYNPNTDTFKTLSFPLLTQDDHNTQYYTYSPTLLSLSWVSNQL
ncbi:hypothetical protein F8388_024043 [Cannabis sativa]|uniref:F-box domain-containing protein n=1 Tax=Cannabis sativa TaxID=3483 RepID=A0A7J6FXB6_CANSA|nr:hypothetical protein G4B88_022007 [Cannabis sativa]KAF4375384.1 hypothetical protein F8388_024043 [Cannabis sativa]